MIRLASRSMKSRVLCPAIIILTSLVVGGCSVWRDFLPTSDNPREVVDRSEAADAFVWYEDWNEATRLAAETDRMLLVNFTGSDWCIWCQRLEDEVFSKSSFSDWAAPRFIGVRLDYPQSRSLPDEVAEQNARLRQQYANLVKAFPTVLVVSPAGEVVAKTGYVQGGPEAWIQQMEAAIESAH